MDKFYPAKKIFSVLLTTVLLITLAFFSCKKTGTDKSGITPGPPDLTTRVSSSVSGFVTDENDAAVQNATVQFGNAITTTDKYGYFEARNIQVIKDAATVTVTSAGYFKGIKTYIATEGKSAFFRIKLIPKTIAGTISGNSGGTVTLTNGLSLSLPAGSVINATTNVAYNGTVNVAANWINPAGSDLPRIMPGDLRGINNEGNEQLLVTYGMAAVELTGTSGELLQIAAGKKATLSLPIPVTLLPTAPATIPLWYFDEAKGLWQQEGTATKTGSNYVGDVGHFSFWNCDVPGNFVQFNCTVLNNTGQPVQNALVKISMVNSPANFRYGYTDSSGYVSGLVPANSQLQIDILGPAACFNPVFTQQFTTTIVPVSLGNINISTNSATATLSGTVINCSNAAVTNGYVVIYYGNSFLRTPLTNAGAYSVTLTICNTGNLNFSLFAEDIAASQQASTVNYTIGPGNNTIPVMQACGTSIQQFVNYSVNNISYSFIAPTDTISIIPHPIAPWVWLSGNKIPFSTTERVTITMTYGAIALGSSQQVYEFTCPQVTAGSTFVNPAFIQITEYGFIGQFISGNFSFVMQDPSPPNTIYNVTGNFRIRRRF